MFKNLVNKDDFSKIAENIQSGRFRHMLRRIFSNKYEKIKDTWEHIDSPLSNWWTIPAVKAHINRIISGDAAVDRRSYVRKQYLSDRRELTALSPGCGFGHNELSWAQMGIFQRIDAFDISVNRIQQAIKIAEENKCGDIIKFSVSDDRKVDWGKSKYDVVLFEGSLHHFSPVEEILQKANDCLKVDGYLVLFDFAGPSRFQWTPRQVEVVNGLLQILPGRYRRLENGKNLKDKVYCPGRLSMVLRDPSEAADSSNIIPGLKKIFDVIELKEVGGTILHLLFNGIAHNFITEGPGTAEFIRLCLEVEEVLLKTGEISSDFVLAVCRKKLK